MTTKQGLSIISKALSIVGAVITLISCSSGAPALQVGSNGFLPYNNNPLYQAPTYSGTCPGGGQIQASLQMLNPIGGVVAVGAPVTWGIQVISAQGCSNLYAIRNDGGASIALAVGQTAQYQKSYSTPSTGQLESITIQSMGASNIPVASTTISSASFSVGSSSSVSGFGCSVSNAPGAVIRIGANNQPLDPPPMFPFQVSSDRPIIIAGIRNLNGDFQPLVNPSSLPPAPTLSLQAVVPAIGYSPIEFTVADASNQANITKCYGFVNVTTTQSAGSSSALTCTLVASAATIKAGTPISFTLTTVGQVVSQSLVISGNNNAAMPIPVGVATPFTPIFATGVTTATATATVYDVTGNHVTCQVPFNVLSSVTTTLSCKSSNGKQICYAAGNVVSAALLTDLDNCNYCQKSNAWGFFPNTNILWVDKKCNGLFTVTTQ